MTATTTQQIDALRSEIATLSAIEVAVETNEGTYSAIEARRAIGVGSQQFADYTIYERVDGDGTRLVGCEPSRAPGRARRLGTEEMATHRRRLADLKKQLRELRS